MSLQLAITSIKGLRPTMQDNYKITELSSGYTFIGLYDGHGGNEAADLACNILHELVENELKKGASPFKAIEESFREIDKKIYDLNYRSGTTATVSLIKANTMYLAHVGDTRVVAKRENKVIQLTKDHRITDSDEMNMYRSSKWFKEKSKSIGKGNFKGFYLISVSRSLGDTFFEDAISIKPDNLELKLSGDEEIIVATDGLWCSVSNEEAFQFTDTDLKATTDRLINEALNKGSKDNITAIYIKTTN
jgi:serine/threonine protein phosphatase PrpC